MDHSKGDAKDCSIVEMSKETCNWQETKLTNVKGNLKDTDLNNVEGIALRYLSDSMIDPEIMIIEGEILFRSFTFGLDSGFVKSVVDALGDVHSVYFRLVKKGHMIWASTDFKDSQGTSISATVPGFDGDLISMLRDGVGGEDHSYRGNCQEFNQEGIVPCKDLNFKDYDRLWVGDDNLDPIDSTHKLPFGFGDIPKLGLITEK